MVNTYRFCVSLALSKQLWAWSSLIKSSVDRLSASVGKVVLIGAVNPKVRSEAMVWECYLVPRWI